MTSKLGLIDEVFALAERTRAYEEDRLLLNKVMQVTDEIYSFINDMTARRMGLAGKDYDLLDRKLRVMEKHADRVAFFHTEGAKLYQQAVELSNADVLTPVQLGEDTDDVIDQAVIDDRVLAQLTKPQLKEVVSRLKGVDTIRLKMRRQAVKTLDAAADVQKCLRGLETHWLPAPRSRRSV